jgi:Zn-dependent protease with chaperone function
MDFFQSQEVARKQTGLLVFLFSVGVVLIIAAVYVALALIVRGTDQKAGVAARGLAALWDPQLLVLVAGGTATLVSGGSLYKIAALSGGGHTVTDLLGGRLIPSDTADPDERRVLNVVEEMAIASGTPVPPVYVLEGEAGINAFAAGYTPGDAVIGVTRGCVQNLSRDELQGVIGHEFSHILNGDMRLNIRLMGVLFGILLIGLTGYLILRSTTRYVYFSDSDDDKKKGGNPLPLIGLALYIIGYVGVFFANLIKASVSRQREFLADASSVQFTRNPDGLAGALKKIGARAQGSHIDRPRAEEASHMFFGQAVGVGTLFGLLATHPPLEERIKRIDPSFDGDFSKVRLDRPVPAPVAPGPPGPRIGRPAAILLDPAAAVARVGTVGPAELAYAAGLVADLPALPEHLAREPFGARAVIFGLLLDADEAVRRLQLDELAARSEPTLMRDLNAALPAIEGLAPEARLPLVALCVPALRQLSPRQYRDFVATVQALVQADQKISLFEFALQRHLLTHLGGHFGQARARQAPQRTAAALAGPIGVVLSALARVGSPDPGEVARAYHAGFTALGWEGLPPEPAASEAVTLPQIDSALDTLTAASPPLKKQVLLACAACIAVDGQITIAEGELLRAVADSLDCPMPPLLTPAGERGAARI